MLNPDSIQIEVLVRTHHKNVNISNLNVGNSSYVLSLCDVKSVIVVTVEVSNWSGYSFSVIRACNTYMQSIILNSTNSVQT